jgi:nicotinate-nucleotide pyrophosphorylase (carboxylating)
MEGHRRWELIDRALALALEEDIGPGDVTTETLVPEAATATGRFVMRDGGVAAGLEVVERLYARIDPGVTITRKADPGQHLQPGRPLAVIEGPARAVLTGERLALNLLQRMCGVATLTSLYVEAVRGTRAVICDTRKTLPGLRAFDRIAVYLGGGQNHRDGLFDMILIKDNHLALTQPGCPKGSTACAVQTAREASDLPVMVEVETREQLLEVLEIGPDMILLDNMDLERLGDSVRTTQQFCRERDLRRPLLEASGRVTLETVGAVARTGVDRISVGALTHSARALDVALDLDV